MLEAVVVCKELEYQQNQTFYCSRYSRNSGHKLSPSNMNLSLRDPLANDILKGFAEQIIHFSKDQLQEIPNLG